jgi:hypothetical protein
VADDVPALARAYELLRGIAGANGPESADAGDETESDEERTALEAA